MKPDIQDVSRTVTVNEGEDIALDCRVISRPKAMLMWSPISSRATMLSNNSLHFNDIALEDAGYYTCSAVNSVGSDRLTILVTVKGKMIFLIA